MGKQKIEPKPEDLDPLRERIRAWRSTRHRPNPIPGEIWDHAVVLARQFGVCKVARAVGLDNTALRKKVATAKELPGLVLPTFVELPGRLFAEEAPVITSTGDAGRRAARRDWGNDRHRHPGWCPDSHPVGGRARNGGGGDRCRLHGRPALIQITPQMRVLVAVEPIDFRKGIDGLAQVCREALKADPFSGTVFVFRGRAGTSIRLLAFDGQGYWLCQKRMSKGRFTWWPGEAGAASARLQAHELQVLICGGDPSGAKVPTEWRSVGFLQGEA